MNQKNKSILITGGAGFIGSHLCDRLIVDNKITVIDNLSLGRKSNIEHLINNNNFSFIEGDLLHKGLNDVFKEGKFDIVFHLAANSDIANSHDNPSIDKDNTFMSTYCVLEMMKKHEVKEIIFASTSAIYGDTNEVLTENYGPLLPVSHYGAGKLASEAFISSFAENYGIKAWIVRFPNVVGDRATHGVIFDFIKKLKINNEKLEVFGNGEQYKPYLYVKDLIDGIIYVWRNSDKKVNVYNLGVNSRTKVKEIASMVIEEMGLNSEIEYTGGDRGWIGDVPEFNYDLNKIHQLGWKASNHSNESVRKAIRYILKFDFN
jgi:UDP-glucose 4-epimerase